MRITHLCLGCFFPDGFSYQENLLPKFHKKQGHEVSVIASPQSYNTDGKMIYVPAPSEYTNEYGISVTRLPYKHPAKLFKKLKRFVGLYDALVKYNPDLIFIHGIQFLDADIVVKYLKKHKNVRVYVDNHADFINSARGFFSKRILHEIIWRGRAKKINPFVAKWYGVLPARVDFLKQEYKLPSDKVELLVMGADDDKVAKAVMPETRNGIRSAYNISDDDFLIITGGKITSGKRKTVDLMKAVNKINRSNVKLIVFGSVAPELADEIKSQCSENVRYIGWVESDLSSDYFAAADLVVFPGLHSVFWEQVAGVGVPMICSHFGGFEHIDVGGNVKFIDTDKDGEIYNALLSVLDDGIYDSMKQTAVEKGMKVFSYNSIAKRSIEETY